MNISSRLFLGQDTYLTYPHCNAFADNGRTLIIGRLGAQSGEDCLLRLSLDTGKPIPLQTMGRREKGEGAVWFDVARRVPRLAAIFDSSVWLLDLNNPADWIRIYTPSKANHPQGLPSISSDGRRVLCGETRGNQQVAVEIDTDTGISRDLFTKDWLANHFHYCPYDESWIGFSHEGPTETIPDRCWVWHALRAPEGRCVFDQQSDVAGQRLCVGHERWSLHDASAYAIAYAVSSAPKRGLYEVFADGRPARLLLENDVLWHCHMNATGRVVALDTTAPWHDGGLSPDRFREGLKRHLETDANKGENSSDIVLTDLQTGEILPVATVVRTRHPYHPHPMLSDDSRWLLYNDATHSKRGVWLCALT